MNTLLAYRKAGLRLAVLSILGLVLIVVAKPTKALALTCQQTCEQDLQSCDTMCHDSFNPDCEYCVIAYNACLSLCD